MNMMHETKDTKLFYQPGVDGLFHELHRVGLTYKPSGRKFKKWDGPSVDCYRTDYDGDFDLPIPPPEEKRIVLYNFSENYIPHYYVLTE